MNAIELLEALLRGGPSAPAEETNRTPSAPAPREARSPGSDWGATRRDDPRPRPATPAADGGAPPRQPGADKVSLPDLLRQAEEQEAAAAAGRPYRPEPAAPRRWSEVKDLPSRAPEPPPQPREEEATVLIRAMVSAAKADGRLDRDEEQKLLRHLGQPSRETVAFIQAEFQRPLDAREFAWSVPLGLEQKVYAISLSVIDVDQREESDYLKELAHGLRLSADVCAQLHKQFGAPLIG